MVMVFERKVFASSITLTVSQGASNDDRLLSCHYFSNASYYLLLLFLVLYVIT